MASARTKSAVVKRDTAAPPAVQHLSSPKGAAFPAGDMLIASPLEIAGAVEAVPEGCVVTLDALRAHLARKFHADYTCPLTTGIFLRIAAEASEEEGPSGRNTPYWRVVRSNGRMIDRFPGGESVQAKRLSREGVRCEAAGKGHRVTELGRYAWSFPADPMCFFR